MIYGWHSGKAALENPAREIRRIMATENAARRLAEEQVRTQVAPEIVRPEDGRMLIVAAATPEAGNWLPLPASGRFQIRLRLYDTPISTQTGETRATNLPRIARLDCR